MYLHVSTYYYTIAITLLIELGNLSKFHPIQTSLDKINFRKIVIDAKILIMWSFSLFSMSLSTFQLGTEFRSDWSIHTCIRRRGLNQRARAMPPCLLLGNLQVWKKTRPAKVAKEKRQWPQWNELQNYSLRGGSHFTFNTNMWVVHNLEKILT